MNTYLLVHRHPHNYAGTPEARAAREAWPGKPGDALVDKGNAVLGGRSVSGEAGTALPLGGSRTRPRASLPPSNTRRGRPGTRRRVELPVLQQ